MNILIRIAAGIGIALFAVVNFLASMAPARAADTQVADGAVATMAVQPAAPVTLPSGKVDFRWWSETHGTSNTGTIKFRGSEAEIDIWCRNGTTEGKSGGEVQQDGTTKFAMNFNDNRNKCGITHFVVYPDQTVRVFGSNPQNYTLVFDLQNPSADPRRKMRAAGL